MMRGLALGQFLVVLGTELSASCMLGQSATNELQVPVWEDFSPELFWSDVTSLCRIVRRYPPTVWREMHSKPRQAKETLLLCLCSLRQSASPGAVTGPLAQAHHHCQPFLLHAELCQRHTVGPIPSWTGILKKIQLYNIWPGLFYIKHLIFQRPVPMWRALWHPWICMINDLYSDLF